MADSKRTGGISKVKEGYKVRKPSGGYFSKKPQTKAKADAQLRAIEVHTRGKGK